MASGFSERITSADYEVVAERLAEAAGAREASIPILCEIADDGRFGLDALLADLRLARQACRISRIAVLGAPSWTSAIAVAADLWPGWRVRHFAPDSREAAERWLDADAAASE